MKDPDVLLAENKRQRTIRTIGRKALLLGFKFASLRSERNRADVPSRVTLTRPCEMGETMTANGK